MDTYFVRRPQRFQVTKGLAYQPQPLSDTQVPITVSEVAGVHFEFDSVERTLSLDFIQDRYAKPAAIALANQINMEAARFIALNTFNAVGTPGTPITTLSNYLAAEDLLVAQGCPQNEELVAIINRKMSSAYIGSANISGLFNSQEIVGAQMRTGRIQQQLGYRWEIDQTIYTHNTVSNAYPTGATVTNTTSADGGNNGTMTLAITGTGVNSTLIAKAGDVITVAGSNSVHPQTRVDTSYLQQAVLLQDATTDSSGNVTLTIFPAFTPQGQYQNVTQAATAGQSILFWAGGTVNSKASPQGLLLHRDAFAFMSVPLEDPDAKGVEMVAQETDPDTGMTLSFIRAFDPISRKHVNRFDTLYGFGRLYSELACRMVA